MKNDIYGYIGGILSSLIFFPQIFKIVKTKQSDDISYMTIIISNVASIFILLYSIENAILPMIVSSIIGLSSRFFVIILKLKYDTKKYSYCICDNT